MLADNILYLKKNYPVLYTAVREFENKNASNSITLEDTRNNYKTLKIKKDEKSLYLHSKYDPIREAESIIDKFEEQENFDAETHVIFYGLGLGYHIDVFVKRYPNLTFSLYEPSLEVFDYYLDHKNITDYQLKEMLTIQCEINPESMNDFFKIVLNKTDKKTVIIDLPIYHNAFAEQYKEFSQKFMEFIKSKRLNLNANFAFQKRWILNSVVNFKEVLNTPNILLLDENIFKSKTAILVSAGPSLNDEIDNLRTIKEKGLAYIFSVGSAINTLIHNDIVPDAICSYDPTSDPKVYKRLNKENINNIPMIFGSSIGFEVLNQYKGPKYHMITSQDTISDYFLKEKDDREISRVNDAPSIAIVTLEMLYKLKLSTIILVGQNFAYKDQKNYAEGIEYQFEVDSENNKDILKAKDVLGNEVFTSESYNTMRRLMETNIKNYNISIINTTIGGAAIEGAEYIPMGQVIEERLQKKIVQSNEFEVTSKPDIYDKEHLYAKLNLMETEYKKYKAILSEIKQLIIKIDELIKNMNIKQMNIMHQKMDQKIHEMEANAYFKVIALPMNRVQYEILANKVQLIKNEKNEFKKLKQIIKETEVFIDLLFLDSDLNQKIMNELAGSIKNYE